MAGDPLPPLEGVRVVCLGGRIAAESALDLLAQQGAKVTRVVRPGVPADDRRPGRGREIPLDLHSREGVVAAGELLRGADVAIENFRPGVMERLGLDAGAMRDSNPGLIYCSMPGFSRTDTRRVGLRAWESLVQASAAATHPWFEGATGAEPPVFNALPVASAFAAFHAVTAISAALIERERSGLGQTIEVSLYGAMYGALGALGLRIHNIHSGPNQVINFVPLVRQYECADGRWVQIHAFTRRSIRQFARAAGVEDWIAEGVLRLGPVIADPAIRKELQSRLERLFRTRTAQAWEDLLSEAGVSCAVCRTTGEWLEHEQARTAGLAIPQAGGRPAPGAQLEITTAPDAAGSPSSARQRAAGAEGALAGIRVLDLCIVLAGTTCGRTLAEYGAEVIKIDDPNRDGGVIFHNDVNRGKQSLLLDLKSEGGRDVFWRLLESADVVVENFRAGAMDRLGLGYEAVRQRKPGVVYVSLNTYGYRGPWAGRPGWEQLAEAASGMQARYGAGGRPTLQPYAVLDFGTGVLAAHGAMLALLQRQRSGCGAHVRTSLIATADTIQSTMLADPPTDGLGGQGFRGPAWFHRYYRASDGWLLIAADERDADAIGAVLGLPRLAGESAPAVLEALLRTAPRARWLERLAGAGVPACAVASIADVMNDPWAREHGLSLQRPHGELGPVDTVGPVALLDRTPLMAGRPATFPGVDAAGVLAEAGFTEAEFDALIKAGVLVVPPQAVGWVSS